MVSICLLFLSSGFLTNLSNCTECCQNWANICSISCILASFWPIMACPMGRVIRSHHVTILYVRRTQFSVVGLPSDVRNVLYSSAGLCIMNGSAGYSFASAEPILMGIWLPQQTPNSPHSMDNVFQDILWPLSWCFAVSCHTVVWEKNDLGGQW